MILNIPYFENNNDGKQCMQVAMKCVISYFLNKDISLDELDKLTWREEGFWTYTSQIVSVLYDLGLDLSYYSKEDLEPLLEWEWFIRTYYGKNADKILRYTDIDVVVKSVEKLLSYDVFEKKVISILDIQNYLMQGYVPMVVIDNNVILGINDFYQGHFVVITWFDEDHIYYHESWPKEWEANKKVEKELFEKAFNANGTANDCVVVRGIR